MNKTLLSALAIFGSLTLSANANQRSHFVVLIDLSASNPMVEDGPHAARIGRDVAAMMSTLGLGDRVTVATFGVYDVRQNKTLEQQVTTLFRPEQARASVQAMLAGTPKAVADKKAVVQGQTEIIGALNMSARRIDCNQNGTTIIVATDGMENSPSHGAMPPPNPEPLFKSCVAFAIVGMRGTTSKHTLELGKAWMTWCQASGFKKCDWRE